MRTGKESVKPVYVYLLYVTYGIDQSERFISEKSRDCPQMSFMRNDSQSGSEVVLLQSVPAGFVSWPGDSCESLAGIGDTVRYVYVRPRISHA